MVIYEYFQWTWNSNFSHAHIYICMYVHIWSITSFSHKCCPALYLGSKLTDHNIHHWSQIPEGNSHRGCTHLDLVAKQGWYAEGSSPEPHWKEGDSWGTIPEEESSGPGTQGVSSKRPHGCRCFISSVTTRNAKFCASPLLVWGCSLWYRLQSLGRS